MTHPEPRADILPLFDPENPTVAYRELGLRLRDAREGRGLRQTDVYRMIPAMHPSILSQVENGRRRLNVFELAALSDLYKVSMRYLVTGRPLVDEEGHLLQLTPEVRVVADQLMGLPAEGRSLLASQFVSLIDHWWMSFSGKRAVART